MLKDYLNFEYEEYLGLCHNHNLHEICANELLHPPQTHQVSSGLSIDSQNFEQLGVTKQTNFHPSQVDFDSKIHPCEPINWPNVELNFCQS